MNERTRELADRAGEYADFEYGICTDEFLEKFAELIVRECYVHCSGQMLDKEVAEAHGLTYNDGVMDCAVGLKLHFGIDE